MFYSVLFRQFIQKSDRPFIRGDDKSTKNCFNVWSKIDLVGGFVNENPLLHSQLSTNIICFEEIMN